MTLPAADHPLPRRQQELGQRPQWAAISRPLAQCAGEGKWAPGSCRWDGCAGGGGRLVAAVSWRLLPRPAGAHFAVEKQLGAAWRLASCCLPLPLQQSVYPAYPAVSPRTRDLEKMLTVIRDQASIRGL